MLPDRRRIGLHLPLGAGMVKAVDRAAEIGASALQVFSDNPTAWRRRSGPPKEAPAFRRRLSEAGIAPVAIHAAYLVNLAGPDEDFFAKSVEVLATELRVAPDFAARFVNVHVGSHRGSGLTAGTNRVARGLALVLDQVEPTVDGAILVLENSAGSGFGIGSTVEELAGIADAVRDRGIDPDRVAFCLDTAHAWGAGYRISEPDEVDSLLASFDERIGLDRLVLVHLNDSRAALGTNADRHEHLAAGSIGAPGLARVLTHPGLGHVTYLLETPGMDEGFDAVNLARALALARGDELPALPPGAGGARGSRSRTPPGPEQTPVHLERSPEPLSESGSDG